MALTIGQLEKVTMSEVENLHIRVDEGNVVLERIEFRIEAIERRIDVLYIAVEDLQVEVKNLKKVAIVLVETMVTKEYFRVELKKELKRYATKQDVKNAIKEELKNYATKQDVKNIVEDLLKKYLGVPKGAL